MPINNEPNHSTCTGRVKIDSCIIAGPGHRPAIPQPRPKQKAPVISFQSIVLFSGLKRCLPRYDYFLYQKAST